MRVALSLSKTCALLMACATKRVVLTPSAQPEKSVSIESKAINSDLLNQLPMSQYTRSLCPMANDDLAATPFLDESLEEFQEPILVQGETCNPECYRLILSHPLTSTRVLRFYRSDGKYFVVFKMKMGQDFIRKQREMSAEEWGNMQNLIENVDLWGLKSTEAPRKQEDIILEAWVYTLEGNCQGAYGHVVRIPRINTCFKETALQLYDVANLTERPF